MRAGGYELDLIVRRGRLLWLVVVTVRASAGSGGGGGAVGAEKQRRVRRAAQGWLVRHPEHRSLEIGFDVVAVQAGKLERLGGAF